MTAGRGSTLSRKPKRLPIVGILGVCPMKRWFVVALAAAAMALVPTAAAADEEHGDGHGKHFGPFKSSSTDSGTCGNDWANDTFKREFFVRQASSGAWEVTKASMTDVS